MDSFVTGVFQTLNFVLWINYNTAIIHEISMIFTTLIWDHQLSFWSCHLTIIRQNFNPLSNFQLITIQYNQKNANYLLKAEKLLGELAMSWACQHTSKNKSRQTAVVISFLMRVNCDRQTVTCRYCQFANYQK